MDLITLFLDGTVTISPGITCASTLALRAEAHSTGKITLPRVPTSVKLHTHERRLTMGETLYPSANLGGICGRNSLIAWKGEDIVLPAQENGFGIVGGGMWRMIVDG